jgi:hypothetical protein
MSISQSRSIPPAAENPASGRKAGAHPAAPFAGVLAREKASKMNMEDMLRRMDAGVHVDTDRKRAQALVSLAQALDGGGGSALESARNALSVRNLMTLAGNFELRAPVMPSGGTSARSSGIRGEGAEKSGAGGQDVRGSGGNGNGQESLGSLAARFESGGAGIAAIGYDQVGGTSYGKYQIASRVGTMRDFLKFLDKEAPDMAGKLRSAGPANTGSRRGRMPEVWQQIAAEQPARFEALQEKFIRESHYAPALDALTKAAGIEPGRLSPAMREVLWSTAVQHGPSGAARIFSRAASRAGGDIENAQAQRKIIDRVYAIRAEQFGSSTEEVRSSVRNRLKQEKALALAMLRENGTGAVA